VKRKMSELSLEELRQELERRLKGEVDLYGDPMLEAYDKAGGGEWGWKAAERVKRRMMKSPKAFHKSTPLAIKCDDVAFEKQMNNVEAEMIKAYVTYGGGDMGFKQACRVKDRLTKQLRG